MPSKHKLGMERIRAGELLSFTYEDTVPNNEKRLTVVALADIDLSLEMATYCEQMDRSGKDIYTENALPAFIEYLTEKRLLHVGNEVKVHFGKVRRPASRLLNEYRFKMSPESFWEEKITTLYLNRSFSVFNHQMHSLTVMMGIDAPFYIMASFIDVQGDTLGVLRLSVLSDSQHTLIDDEDLERLRLALQADIAMNLSEINVMVDRVKLTSNPDFGLSSFKRHLPAINPENQVKSSSQKRKGKQHASDKTEQLS